MPKLFILESKSTNKNETSFRQQCHHQVWKFKYLERHNDKNYIKTDSHMLRWQWNPPEDICTGCPKKMYHICFVYSFYSFQHSQLRPTSKDSQFHGDLLTLPMDSVASSWLSLWHVLEVPVFLGHTAMLGVWLPRPNIRLGKSREWPQGSPVSKFPRFLVAPGA